MTDQERRELMTWLIRYYERDAYVTAMKVDRAPEPVLSEAIQSFIEAKQELMKRACLITEFKAECMRVALMCPAEKN